MHRPGRFVLIAAAAVLAITLPTPVMAATSTQRSVPSSVASLGAWKAAHDTDPHTPIVNSSHHQGWPIGKQRAADSLRVATSSIATLGIPASKLIAQNQQGQQTGYWCGPAAESEAIGILGASYSQSSEASYLKTTTNGTAWSGVNANVPASFQTGYPMRDVLNYEYYVYTNGGNAAYSVVAVPSTPSQTDTNNYISNMSGDVYYDWPVLGNAWEVAGYPQYHLTGHPDITIFHWFTVIGYQNYGNLTSYEDSATTVWSTVPAYTLNFSSPTLVIILGGRGYVW